MAKKVKVVGGGRVPFNKNIIGDTLSLPPPHELSQIARGRKRKKNFGLGKKNLKTYSNSFQTF
jgi:hypothetical protein